MVSGKLEQMTECHIGKIDIYILSNFNGKFTGIPGEFDMMMYTIEYKPGESGLLFEGD
jgi:hypothetical protein